MRKPRILLRGTGAGAGVDSAWEQKKLEARKKSENAAREAPQRPVHIILVLVQDTLLGVVELEDSLAEKDIITKKAYRIFTHNLIFGNRPKNTIDQSHCLPAMSG